MLSIKQLFLMTYPQKQPTLKTRLVLTAWPEIIQVYDSKRLMFCPSGL